MTKITNFEKTSDPGFVPALNENLKELHRRVERQAERIQRIEGLRMPSPGLTILEVPHKLGVIPKMVTIEIFTDAPVWFGKPHTEKAVFLQSTTATIKVNVVVRG